jgi:hypothetical protein
MSSPNGKTISRSIPHVAAEQKRWSQAASELGRSLTRWRNVVLCLAIAGAICETASVQLSRSSRDIATFLGYTGSISLAVIPIIRGSKLTSIRSMARSQTRAVSEAIKKELYLYRMTTSKYSSAEAKGVLSEAVSLIVENNRDIVVYTSAEIVAADISIELMNLAEYIQERVYGQITFYRNRASALQRTIRSFESMELLLALLGAAIAALATFQQAAAFGVWVAVITTAAAAVSARAGIARLQTTTRVYLLAASRLECMVGQVDSYEPSQFVEACESIISDENGSWLAAETDQAIAQQPGKAPQIQRFAKGGE